MRDVYCHLLTACPHLSNELRTARGYTNIPTGLPYVDVGAVGALLAEMVTAGDLDCIARVFAAAETLLAEDDAEQWSLTTVGFLESFQNVLSHARTEFDPITSGLGPATLEAWTYLNELWAGNKPAPPARLRGTDSVG